MSLLTSEVSRIKAELGYPLLATGAEPYIGIVSLFESVIQPYLLSGATTTSATPVTAATSPTPVTITLASATGIFAGDVLVVDVDSRQERATIAALSGANATVQLSLTHSATYPVTVEGGETIVRDILQKLVALSSGMNGSKSQLASLVARAGIKRIDDLEFFGGGNTLASQGVDPVTQVFKLRELWRDELAFVLGVPRLNSPQAQGGSSIAVY